MLAIEAVTYLLTCPLLGEFMETLGCFFVGNEPRSIPEGLRPRPELSLFDEPVQFRN